MKRIIQITLLTAVIFSCLNPLSAQEEKKTTYALKLYYNHQPNAANFLTPSLFIQKKKASHEFELSQLGLGIGNEIDIDGYNGGEDDFERTDAYFSIGLKYEYGMKFLNINEKFDFSLHASAEPYFNIYKSSVAPYNERHRNGRILGGRFSLIPRATYTISDRWFVDVNFPIELVDVVSAKHRYIVSGNDRTSIRNSLSFFDRTLRLRVGIGLKL